jgi:hypothetical protein
MFMSCHKNEEQNHTIKIVNISLKYMEKSKRVRNEGKKKLDCIHRENRLNLGNVGYYSVQNLLSSHPPYLKY